MPRFVLVVVATQFKQALGTSTSKARSHCLQHHLHLNWEPDYGDDAKTYADGKCDYDSDSDASTQQQQQQQWILVKVTTENRGEFYSLQKQQKY